MKLPAQPEFDKKKGVPEYERGTLWPAWLGIAIPFLSLMAILYKRVKNLSIKAALGVVLVFEIGTFFIEHHAVVNGHWVYNRAKLLGPLIWDVPIEEIVIYYFFPPLFVIFIMLLFYQFFLKRLKK